MGLKEQAQRLIKQRFGEKQSVIKRKRGILGDGSGVVRVEERPDVVYIRINADPQNVWKVFNDQVADVDNLPVIIEEQPDSRIWRVVEIDRGVLTQVGDGWAEDSFRQTHHEDHEWPYPKPGRDPVSVFAGALEPLRTEPTTSYSLNINIRPYIYTYEGTIHQFPGNTLNVASYIPDSGIRYAVSYLDVRENASYVIAGSPVTYEVGATPPIPMIPWFGKPSALIILRQNQDIVTSPDIIPISDIRAQSGIKNNLQAQRAPTVNDDYGAGYSPGSIWIDRDNATVYICVSASLGVADWDKFSSNQTQTIYVGKHGSDNNDGLSVDNAYLTIGAAITAGTSLINGGAANVRIEVVDGGTYDEDLTLTTGLQIHAPGIRLIGEVSLAAKSSLLLNEHYAENESTAMVSLSGDSGHAVYRANLVDTRGTGGSLTTVIAILNASSGGILHAYADHIFVGESGGGIADAVDGFGHTHFRVGDLYLAGDGATGIGTFFGGTKLIGYIDHILKVNSPSSTTAISLTSADTTVFLSCLEIIADTAYNISAGSLYLFCLDINGTKTGSPTVLVPDSGGGGWPYSAVTVHPSDTNADYDDLQDAIDNSSAGDLIIFDGEFDLDSGGISLDVDKALTIMGLHPNTSVITSSLDDDETVEISAAGTLENCTVNNTATGFSTHAYAVNVTAAGATLKDVKANRSGAGTGLSYAILLSTNATGTKLINCEGTATGGSSTNSGLSSATTTGDDVEVIDGRYSGSTYDIQLTSGAMTLLGPSGGPQFKNDKCFFASTVTGSAQDSKGRDAGFIVQQNSGTTVSAGSIGVLDDAGDFDVLTFPTIPVVQNYVVCTIGGSVTGDWIFVKNKGSAIVNYTGSAPSAGDFLIWSSAFAAEGQSYRNHLSFAVCADDGSGGQVEVILLIDQQILLPWYDYELFDIANASGIASHFKDHDSSYPAGWTESDAALETNTNQKYSFWYLRGSSGEASWKYRITSSLDLENDITSSQQAKFILGPIILRDGQFTADIDYYFGVYADTGGGAIDESVYSRVHIQWDSTGGVWQIRGEENDGSTPHTGSWITFGDPFHLPFWIAFGVYNSANKTSRTYLGTALERQTMTILLNQNPSSAPTWGDLWVQFHQSRSSGVEDYLFLGALDYAEEGF